MKRFVWFLQIFSLLLFMFLFVLPESVVAESQNCSNRYTTLVNPVRGRNLWFDNSLKPISDQYLAAAEYKFPVTWLLQYDALTDTELIDKVKSFEIIGEKGVFLEISKNLADDSKVVYPSGLRWSDPGIVFLSAYSQSERKFLIDTVFNKFKKDFGYYPKSVGAWWIDSYSLNYINEKYGLNAILIVADQKTTDSYGVWGQWWGYPYYPSKNNVLVPSNSNFLNAVVIQWAQRDLSLAYGEGSKFSNYSLQANDYIRSGKDTNYFKEIVDSYLDCQNSVGQITIGMETGMESVPFHNEYLNQLEVLSKYNGLQVVTMNDFAKYFKNVNNKNPSKVIIGGWNLTLSQRENIILADHIKYNKDFSFSDYFIADKNSFLNRDLSISGSRNVTNILPWFFVLLFILGIYSLRRGRVAIWISSTFFTFASFGLILRSAYKYGWQVYYGPVIYQILFIQCLLVLIVFTFFYLFFTKVKTKLKNIDLLMWLLPFSFGLDYVLSIFRYTVIDGNCVVGFLIGRTRIVGLSISESLKLINIDLNITQALALLKFPFDKIWQNSFIYIFIYPLIHILLSFVLYVLLVKLPSRVRLVLLVLLTIIFVMQIVSVFNTDPRMVLSIGT